MLFELLQVKREKRRRSDKQFGFLRRRCAINVMLKLLDIVYRVDNSVVIYRFYFQNIAIFRLFKIVFSTSQLLLATGVQINLPFLINQ